MNILYELDNNFAPQVCASMASVCENNRECDDLRFFVFGLGLSKTVVHNLEVVAQQYGREVSIIPIDGFMEEFGEFDTLGWNEVVLSRLLVNKFLPAAVSRVLHLDGDTIVRGDLSELWCTALGPDYHIGAVIEPTVDRKRIEELGLSAEPYFNAGVLLIDLEQWRAEGIEDGLVGYCLQNHERLFANDQDAINAFLAGRIKPVSPVYNSCNTYEFYPYRVLLKLMGNIPYYSESEVREARKNPRIVHYLGEERPWRAGNRHRFRRDYTKYLNLTPYANVGLERGWRLYFLVWYTFNFVMKPLPMTRYRIITALIPKMMAIRKAKRTAR